MFNRKKNRPSRNALVAHRPSLLFEGLEDRQLLSVAPHHHHHHHHRAVTTATATATHNFVIKNNAGTNRPMTASSPVGLSPATVRHAYGMDTLSFNGVAGDGSGQTIAIVDAYNDPNMAADLHTFGQTFGLSDPALSIVGQTGSSTLPGVDPSGKGNSWAVETSLDVEWAHAVAPAAKILLVEANSTSDADLFQAVDTARRTAGVSVVSMSWGGPEFSGDSAYDSYFTTPSGHTGVTFVASSGDSGAYSGSSMAVEYPAASPNVLAVGGTRLSVDSSGGYLSESAWGNGTSSGTSGGAGGGISRYTTQPTYQNGVVSQTSSARAVPDVAFLADPASGVAVVDSYDFGTTSPWLQVGGTSLAAPMWGGVMATVNQARALNGKAALDGATGTLPSLYALPASDFHDITTGNNGYAAGAGYDLVTGRGTPIVNLLVPALAGNTSVTPPPTYSPTIASAFANPASVTAGTTTTLTASGVQETGGTISAVKFYQETNGTSGLQSASDSLIGSATQTASGTWTLNVSTTGASAGTYTLYAVATDASGVSSAATPLTLTITTPVTSNDNFANATRVSGTGVSITSSNVNATREAGEPYIANNRGGRSVWFVWTAQTSGRVSINTHGSSFDTLLGVYVGNSVSTLSRIASNDDDPAGGTLTSAVTFNAVAGQTYRIAVDGYNGASGTVKLNIG